MQEGQQFSEKRTVSSGEDVFTEESVSKASQKSENGKSIRRYRKNQNEMNGKNSGHWNTTEQRQYYRFLTQYFDQLNDRRSRRLDKVFKKMAEFVPTRDPNQCRSHHQKMEKRFSSLKEIIQNLSKYADRPRNFNGHYENSNEGDNSQDTHIDVEEDDIPLPILEFEPMHTIHGNSINSVHRSQSNLSHLDLVLEAPACELYSSLLDFREDLDLPFGL